MPLFLDVHRNVAGAGPDEVAAAHQKDLATQSKYGVKYVRYWFAESTGTIFCLVEAPSREAAAQVHREAHGLVADEIYAVVEGD
jgi:leucyl aminopeptidase (aminopeptidase T)